MIDGGKPARRELLQGIRYAHRGEVLSLVPAGKSAGGIYGWDFKWGTTGLCPLGGGYFYISQNARSKETKQQSSTVRLYRWTGDGCPLPAGRIAPPVRKPWPGRSCERPGVFFVGCMRGSQRMLRGKPACCRVIPGFPCCRPTG